MNNIWIKAAESHAVCDRIDDEETRLQYYYLTDREKLDTRITEIAQATIDEFWQPSAFSDSENYCAHMMHWKELVDRVVPQQTAKKVNDYKNGNLFNFIVLSILDEIEFYNRFYSDLFYDRCKEFACGCKVCFDPKKAIAV